MVVNPGDTARLRTLTATDEGCRTATSESSGNGGPSATAHGLFLVCSVTITNTSSGPQTFDPEADRSALALPNSHYSESFDAENTADPNSFVSQSDPIQPGESATGDLIYDMPPNLATSVANGTARAEIQLVDFDEDPTKAKSVAALRLYGVSSSASTQARGLSPGAAGASMQCDPNIYAGPRTSCPFAENVFRAVAAAYQRSGQLPGVVTASSPTTHLAYSLRCNVARQVTCTTVDGAIVAFSAHAVFVY